ncbi:colicin immunity domain-containing protein [Dickeya zeae]|uniref:colicin immunity domain-containing protein n=1 Tax=Dickeya zeae TaxID=204042 RepID=UPI000D762746|nr:colicin immunity domain-containing protein [Dickeya zeae]PXW48288.1 self-protective colicin-like immunity protein [Erwinia sp. AG740]UJR61656.1 colicin immunity protein [Dickeya zeae]
MSQYLKDYIDEFIRNKITAVEFSDEYITRWKAERDNNILGKDAEDLSELLSSAFCFADMYNPDDDREEYELNDEQLRERINELVINYKK